MQNTTRDKHEKPRLLLTRRLPDPLMERIGWRFSAWVNPHDRTLTREELQLAVEQHQPSIMLVMAMDQIDAACITGLPDGVQVIATLSVGHEHIDIETAQLRSIAVLHTPDVLSNAVAEIAILLILGSARRAREGAQLIDEDRWLGWSPTQLLGRDVTGARLGILGMGRIGRTIAKRAARGFEMQVHYHNRSRLPPEVENGATYHASLEGLLAKSEFLVLAAPSTAKTKGILNADSIGKLPRGGIVVNIARGDLIDDEALIDALRSGYLAAAGLDVFNNEPRIHPGYRELSNVFMQPHQGSSTMGTRVRMGSMLLDRIDALTAGEEVSTRLA